MRNAHTVQYCSGENTTVRSPNRISTASARSLARSNYGIRCEAVWNVHVLGAPNLLFLLYVYLVALLADGTVETIHVPAICTFHGGDASDHDVFFVVVLRSSFSVV